MRIAISGTYSTGKTTTATALSHLTGIPRTHARTMREILPEAFPGKRLEDCTAPELFGLGMRRYAERAVHESHLPGGFISDGSSLHEWVYGTVRLRVGINPNLSAGADPPPTEEMRLFQAVLVNMGAVVRQHAAGSYDLFIHLPVEFPLVADGHRPVSERFRHLSDTMLRSTLDEMGMPYHVVGGTVAQRLERITLLLGLREVMPVRHAIRLAARDMAGRDTTDEIARSRVPVR